MWSKVCRCLIKTHIMCLFKITCHTLDNFAVIMSSTFLFWKVFHQTLERGVVFIQLHYWAQALMSSEEAPVPVRLKGLRQGWSRGSVQIFHFIFNTLCLFEAAHFMRRYLAMLELCLSLLGLKGNTTTIKDILYSCVFGESQYCVHILLTLQCNNELNKSVYMY